MRSPGLGRLLAPRSLAIFGASRDPDKWGHRVIGYCRDTGFGGPIYAVNRAADVTEIAGAPVVRRLTEISEQVDCVLIAVPAGAVEDAVGECAAVGAGAAVIAASGFAEIGEEGHQTQTRIAATAAGASLRLLGPNCFGLYRAAAGLVLTPHNYFAPGSVALLTQSGNVAIAVSRMLRRAGLGFSTVVGIGNQIDIGFAELLEWLADDEQTAVIGLYAEGLTPGSGDRFVRALDRCGELGKPIVVLKSGRSSAGTSVAATHTAALASDDRVWTSMLDSHGAVRVDSTEALVDALACGASLPRLKGRRVAVVTDGGGDSTMAADAIEAGGLELAQLGPATLRALDALVPPAAPRAEGLNPITIDTPGGMDDDPRLMARCVEVLSADTAVDAVIVGGVFGGYRFRREEERESAVMMTKLAADQVPLVIQSAFADSDADAITTLRASGLAIYPTFARLVAALATRMPPPPLRGVRGDRPSLVRDPGVLLSPIEAAGILASAGIGLPPMRMASSESQLAGAIATVPPPYCLKLADPAVSHKSDLHAVYLGLEGPSELAEAATALWRRFPGSPLLLMPTLPRGVEVLVSAFHDELFGTTLLLGRGGIWAEIEQDTVVLAAPQSVEEVESRLRNLRMWPMLAGGRGQPSVDVEALCDLALALGRLVNAHPSLTVEVNPVICYHQGCSLADIRMLRK